MVDDDTVGHGLAAGKHQMEPNEPTDGTGFGEGVRSTV
jgi:hypothetical protein